MIDLEQDLNVKLEIVKDTLNYIVGINKAQPNAPGYEKLRFCQDKAKEALEAIKLKNINLDKIGKFDNIPEHCPYCKASVTYDVGTSVDYACDSSASRLSGFFYKRCTMKEVF